MSTIPTPNFRPRTLELFQSPRRIESIPAEIMAGITVGLIALPLAIALGIASIPEGTDTPLPAPALGILTAIVAGFLISLLGGSRVQIGGPTAAFIPIVIMIVSEHGYSGLLVVSIMAGIILVLMGFFRMGTLIKFIPWPVTCGFTTGIAVSIMLSQLPDFLGIQSSTPVPHEFFEKARWLIENLIHTNPYTIGLSMMALAVIFLWSRLNIRRLPGSIVGMVLVTIVVALLGWGTAHGVATIGSKFGSQAIPTQIPPLQWPEWEWSHIRGLIGPAFAIALLGAIESLLSAVVADGLSGDRHDSNTELIAQGIANIVCPFLGGLPATGAIARTSANIQNGATTPISGMIHAITLLLIAVLAAKWVVYIPMAATSAVLMYVALRMGEWHEMMRLRKMPASDALVLLATFGLTVVFDLVVAVEVGMVLAAVLFIKRVSETTEVSRVTSDDMLERPEQIAQGKPIPDGVVVYRIFGPFLFGAAEKMEQALTRHGHRPKVLILRLNLVTAMDTTGLNALESLVEHMNKHGSTVILSGLHSQPLDLMKKAGFIDLIGRKNLCATFDDALTKAEAILESAKHPHEA